MTQWIKALAVNPDDPSSSPGVYMVQGEKELLKVVSGLHRWTVAYVHTHRKAIKSTFKIPKEATAIIITELC